MKLDIQKIDRNIVYKLNYSSLSDIHDYLSQDPEINTQVFYRQASMKKDEDFAGEPLERAIEYCIEGYSEGLDNFLVMNRELKKAGKELADSRKMVRGLYGGVPLAPLVAANVPDCMSRYEKDNNATVRNVYYNIGCPWYTSTKQIINKGLITLFIINALEERGEMINFRAFEASREGNEIVDIEVALKRPGEAMLDVGKCYFPLVRKEFLRRILFRTLESIPVKNGWADGYGVSLKKHELKKYLNAKDDDIILSYPEELDIHGEDLTEDAISTLKTLKLTDEFDIEKIKRLHL